MNHNISLKSVLDFEAQNIHFFIPSYQRGYRWKEKQVCQLIDDIESFVPTEDKPFYFLQALAVATDNECHRVNVVDGQQRLTTLSLILGEEYKGIHISYAREANKALDKYFKETAKTLIENRLGFPDSPKRIQFCDKLKKCCRFLYYEVDADKELLTFYELNSGKIPAKDSELVKCIMLTLGTDESSFLTQARAKEWDEMERMLNNDDFFAYMTPRNTKRESDRMTVLLRYAGYIPSVQDMDEEVFPFLSVVQKSLESHSRVKVWTAICAAYYRLLEWYNDPLMYHAFGATVHMRGRDTISSITDGGIIIPIIEKMAKYTPNDQLDDYHTGGNLLYHYLLLSNV